MRNDSITIFEINRLLLESRATIKLNPFSKETFNLIKTAILSGVRLPSIYIKEDKEGKLYFDDEISTIFYRLLNQEEYEFSPKEIRKIEDYKFNISILPPYEINEQSLEFFNNLKLSFNILNK